MDEKKLKQPRGQSGKSVLRKLAAQKILSNILDNTPGVQPSRKDNFADCNKRSVVVGRKPIVIARGDNAAILRSSCLATCNYAWCPHCSSKRAWKAFSKGTNDYEVAKEIFGENRVFLLHCVSTVPKNLRSGADLSEKHNAVTKSISMLKKVVRNACRELFKDQYSRDKVAYHSGDMEYVVSDFASSTWFVHKHFYSIVVCPSGMEDVFADMFKALVTSTKAFTKHFHFGQVVDFDSNNVDETTGRGFLKFHDDFRPYVFVQNYYGEQSDDLMDKAKSTKSMSEMIEIIQKRGFRHRKYTALFKEFFLFWSNLGASRVPISARGDEEEGGREDEGSESELKKVVPIPQPPPNWIDCCSDVVLKKLGGSVDNYQAVHFILGGGRKSQRFTMLLEDYEKMSMSDRIATTVDIHKFCMGVSRPQDSPSGRLDGFVDSWLNPVQICFLDMTDWDERKPIQEVNHSTDELIEKVKALSAPCSASETREALFS